MKHARSKKAAWVLALALSCLTVWSAIGRAQTGSSQRNPGNSGTTIRKSRQVVVLSQVEPQPTGQDASPGAVPDVTSAGDPRVNRSVEAARIKRVTVRLDGMASPPVASTALPPEVGSKGWVDLAIPQQFFNDVKNGAPTVMELPKPNAALETPPQATEQAPQDESQKNTQFESSESTQQNQTLENQMPDQREPPDFSVLLDGGSPGYQAPTNNVPESPSSPVLGIQDPRVPGATYTPQQAIPDWIHGQGETLHSSSPEDSQASESIRQVEQPPAETSTAKSSNSHWPELMLAEYHPAHVDAVAQKIDYNEGDFSTQGGPQGSTFDPQAALHVYRGKFPVPVQRPLIELWRPLYTSGIYPPALTWFGVTNPMKPHFMVYGDMRTVAGANRNAVGKSNAWGNVLNLDMDLQLTSTERLHAFVAPLNSGTTATGLSFNDEVDFVDAINFDLVTLFFEGDLGALTGGATRRFPPFDLPFTFGLIPLVYQNGIWANDAVLGAAVALPARHSRRLKWSNFDASFFWATDNITTDAFPGQDSASDFFGTAWFIDAYEGYLEAGYAFVNDNVGGGRSYHNLALAFTRRYLAKVSNSVRFIVNLGQEDLAVADRTADGHLLLIENSFITAYPNTVVPYLNFFYGQGSPQSLARVGLAGGILNNTGINFETDGITGYPTLDATGHNTFGFAAGINLLGSQFSHQLVLETAMLKATGSPLLRNAEGDQYATGLRYQKPLSHNLIFRTDHMVAFREGASNLNGSRFEFRWKF